MKHVLNQYFDRIYCITVHTFAERHKQVETQLRGIDFQWVFSPLTEWLVPSPQITLSEKSITIGDIAAIQDAKLHRFKRIAIWEDDGILTGGEQEMQTFFDELPANWDCLYMGNSMWSDKIWPIVREPVSENVYRITRGNGSPFTGIQAHVYGRLLNALYRFDQPADFKFNTLFCNRKNTFAPKNFFCFPNSMPDGRYRNRFTDEEWASHIPSYIIHTV